MSDFELENRYLVLKVDDIDSNLDIDQQEDLFKIVDQLSSVNAIVVEEKWQDEYAVIHALIEAKATETNFNTMKCLMTAQHKISNMLEKFISEFKAGKE